MPQSMLEENILSKISYKKLNITFRNVESTWTWKIPPLPLKMYYLHLHNQFH